LRKIQSLDLLHIHGGGYINLILGQWLRFATGRKVILKISSDGWDTPEAIVAGRHGWLAGWCYRRLDGLIAMTSGQANKCRTWGYRGHLEVIPNGVDCSRFRPASEGKKLSLRRQFGLDTKAIVMCYIGVLRRRKGIDILFRVWQELSRRGNVILLIAGGYPGTDAEQVFLSALKEQGFDVPPEGIVYLGHMSNTEQCLQASDIFVFPSRKEGFGTVQIEAMACGLPCFVNDLPGVSSDIFPSKEFGHRIENNDVERYVELITHCLRNPDMYEKIACKARERAEHVYSIERIASTYRQFYACVMGESCREKPSCPSAN
jgi:glycosyltransferase involved in cell wall biosynthesis